VLEVLTLSQKKPLVTMQTFIVFQLVSLLYNTLQIIYDLQQTQVPRQCNHYNTAVIIFDFIVELIIRP